METTIREMTTKDADDVHRIETSSFPNTSWEKAAFLKEINDNEFAHYFVITEDEVIVGYVGIWIVHEHSQITTIAVDEQKRGCGYGKMLMQFAITFSTLNTDTMSLEVAVDNSAAISLYQSFGFNFGGIRKDYYGQGAHAHVMWVKLND